jgi:hypothetical protein
MKSINVEILMGHTIGVSDSYYKPTEKEILEDFSKAIPILSIIKEDTEKIQQELDDLRTKNENNEYLINSKLQQRDDAYITLSDQLMKLMEEVKLLKNSKQINIKS